MLARAAKIPGEARAFNKANSRTLRIAATHALSFTFMPGWLRGLESKMTIGQVQLISDVLQRCEAMLLESQVQFLLSHASANAAGVLDNSGYPYIIVGDDLLLPLSAPDEHGKPLHLLDKSTQEKPARLLSYSPESGIGRIITATQGSMTASLPAATVFTAHLASVLRTMALEGRGIAWLPQTLIADDLARGLLVEAAPQHWRIPMQIRLYRDKAGMSKAGEDFWTAALTRATWAHEKPLPHTAQT